MKKLLCTILALITAISCLTFTVSAASSEPSDTFNPDTYPSLEEQLQVILSNKALSQSQRSKAVNAYAKVTSLKSNTSYKINSFKSYVATELAVPFFNQVKNYYCGPATTKQTYSFLNYRDNNDSWSPTLDTLASKDNLNTTTSGTEQSKIQTYLNNKFNESYFVDWSFDAEEASELIYSAIHDNNRPPILHIIVKSTSNTGWLYETNGHYLNVCGYDATCTSFTVVDPYYDGHGISTGKYTVSAQDINLKCDRMMI